MTTRAEPRRASPLVRWWIRGDRARERGVWVALHADGEAPEGLAALCRAAAPGFDLCAPQGPRSRNPLLSSGHTGPTWGVYSGYSWYRADDSGAPEPTSFADSVRAVARLVEEVREAMAREPTVPGKRRLPAPVFLLGEREGAAVAAASAERLGGRVDGVVLIAGPAAAGGRTPTLALDAPDARAIGEWVGRRGGEAWTRARANG